MSGDLLAALQRSMDDAKARRAERDPAAAKRAKTETTDQEDQP